MRRASSPFTRTARRLQAWALLGAAAALPAFAAAPQEPSPRATEIVQGQCFICHGGDGESSSPAFPRLAGQNAAYVARQLADY